MVDWLWTYFISKVRNLEWAPCIMELRREVSFSLPPKSKILFQFKHWAFLYFPLHIPNWLFLPCFGPSWAISFHFWPFLGHFILFGPFLGHFILDTLYRQGRGWSIYQFRYPSTLNKKSSPMRKIPKSDHRWYQWVQFLSSLLLSL